MSLTQIICRLGTLPLTLNPQPQLREMLDFWGRHEDGADEGVRCRQGRLRASLKLFVLEGIIGLRVLGFRVEGLGFGVEGLGLRV